MIVSNAHRINHGEYPRIQTRDTDFFLERRNSVQAVAESVTQLVARRLPNFLKVDPLRGIQVMTPMKRSDVGVYALNRMLQEALNPPERGKSELHRGEVVFRLGDKVMQIKNDYQLEWEIRGKYGIPVEKGMGIFNGDMGVIREINEFAELMTIEFDEGRFVDYSFKQLEELELAYAITIHKSQGSEYPAVVIPLLSGPKMLMSRNLLYTAVTRARRCVAIIGSDQTFDAMVANRMERNRYTTLDLRIQEF